MTKQLFLIFSLAFSLTSLNAMREGQESKSSILQNAINLKKDSKNLLETLNNLTLITINATHLDNANNLAAEYHSIKQEAKTKGAPKVENYLGRYVKPILRDIYKSLAVVFIIENPFEI